MPPIFSLYPYQRILVIPFENRSPDPDLARELQEGITGQIVGLGAVSVLDADQVDAYLKKTRTATALAVNDPEQRKKLGEEFQADLILVGTAEGYGEYLKDRPPERVVLNDSTGEAEWGFHTDRKVTVQGSAKLVEVASGSLLWTKKSDAYSAYNSWNPLPIPGSLQMPEQLKQFIDLAALVKHRVQHGKDGEPASSEGRGELIYPKSDNFAGLRRKALNHSVNYLVSDFRGRNGWTPPPVGAEAKPE
jgi:hypothetical protein